jgi:hypothetical protein
MSNSRHEVTVIGLAQVKSRMTARAWKAGHEFVARIK